jgi:hypothetical protein
MERRAAPAATPGSIPCTAAAFAELGSEVLQAGVSLRFRARGTSMVPLVRDGDVVLVRPVEPRLVGVGDVVLCTLGGGQPERVVVHRVVGRRAARCGPLFMVQGDRVAQPDGTVAAAQVLGRVAAIERAGREIDLSRPAMRLLGSLAVLRSRWKLDRRRGFGLVSRLVRRLPGLSKYLA